MNFHEELIERSDIPRLHRQVRRELVGDFSLGSASAADLLFLHDTIAEARPKSFLEVGVASGLSSSFLGRFLELHGGERFVGIDVSDRFYADPTRKLGFFIESLLPSPALDFQLRPKHSALDLESVASDFKFEACFIDANHKHPHPLLDTLLVLPYLSEGAWVLHHDLTLWTKQNPPVGIGPKHLFDSLADDPTRLADSMMGNVFRFRFSGRLEDYVTPFCECMQLPWTLKQAMNEGERGRICAGLQRFYPVVVAEIFEQAGKRAAASLERA